MSPQPCLRPLSSDLHPAPFDTTSRAFLTACYLFCSTLGKLTPLAQPVIIWGLFHVMKLTASSSVLNFTFLLLFSVNQSTGRMVSRFWSHNAHMSMCVRVPTQLVSFLVPCFLGIGFPWAAPLLLADCASSASSLFSFRLSTSPSSHGCVVSEVSMGSRSLVLFQILLSLSLVFPLTFNLLASAKGSKSSVTLTGVRLY